MPSIAYADLPLTIEDLVTNKGKAKLNVSLTYANSDQSGVLVAGGYSYATIEQNQDVLIGTLRLRYGLTSKTEIHGRGSASFSSTRGIIDSSASIGSNIISYNFIDSWLGISHQLKKDDDTP